MYSFLAQLLQPYVLLHLLVWAVVLQLWYRRRESRGRLAFLTLSLFALTLLSIPAAAHVALATLESQYPQQNEVPAAAQALVVLGGTVVPLDEAGNKFTLAPDSLYRCQHAVELYQQRRLPILVCGGKSAPESTQQPVAEAMADFLRSQGIPGDDLLVEANSHSTYENALEARRMLEERGVHQIVLVTEAYHMPRAARCFRRQGLDVVASPCCPQTAYFRWGPLNFLPDPYAPLAWWQATHEWIGLAWYGLLGRI